MSSGFCKSNASLLRTFYLKISCFLNENIIQKWRASDSDGNILTNYCVKNFSQGMLVALTRKISFRRYMTKSDVIVLSSMEWPSHELLVYDIFPLKSIATNLLVSAFSVQNFSISDEIKTKRAILTMLYQNVKPFCQKLLSIKSKSNQTLAGIQLFE